MLEPVFNQNMCYNHDTNKSNMFKKLFAKKNKNINKIAEKELRENLSVLKSLKDYDQGKKEISTNRVADRMHDLQATQ
jgi:hypothetical protein